MVSQVICLPPSPSLLRTKSSMIARASRFLDFPSFLPSLIFFLSLSLTLLFAHESLSPIGFRKIVTRNDRAIVVYFFFFLALLYIDLSHSALALFRVLPASCLYCFFTEIYTRLRRISRDTSRPRYNSHVSISSLYIICTHKFVLSTRGRGGKEINEELAYTRLR